MMIESPGRRDIVLNGFTIKDHVIRIQSMRNVDAQWIADSDMTEEEAAVYAFESIVNREMTDEERNKIRDYLDQSVDDREKKIESLVWAVRHMSEAEVRGIYQFKDKQLTLCLSPPREDPPKSFTVGKKGGELLITLKQVAAKANATGHPLKAE